MNTRRFAGGISIFVIAVVVIIVILLLVFSSQFFYFERVDQQEAVKIMLPQKRCEKC